MCGGGGGCGEARLGKRAPWQIKGPLWGIWQFRQLYISQHEVDPYVNDVSLSPKVYPSLL